MRQCGDVAFIFRSEVTVGTPSGGCYNKKMQGRSTVPKSCFCGFAVNLARTTYASTAKHGWL